MDHGQTHYGWTSNEACNNHSYTLPAILRLLPVKNGTILDAGCGNGYVAGYLAQMGYRVIGADLSQDGIEIAQKTYPDVSFAVHSVYDDFQLITEPVDICISSEVIEHLYYPKTFLDNIYKIIRPGGWVILTTPYHGYLKNLALSLAGKWDNHFAVNWEGGHIKFFSEHSLSQMLKAAGFGNIQFGNAGRVKWLWKSMVCRAQKQ